jgi:hypothetical protein
MNDRITLRLGTLAEPLAAACAASGKSPSVEIRERLAESLGCAEPYMPQGFAAMDAKTAAKARKKSGRARRRAKSG